MIHFDSLFAYAKEQLCSADQMNPFYSVIAIERKKPKLNENLQFRKLRPKPAIQKPVNETCGWSTFVALDAACAG
jgi:hypothetical protein